MLAVFSASSAFALPTLRVVTNTNDSGAGSLRQTILDADASNTEDTIEFESGVTGTIALTTGSLVIEHSLTITGPGASTLAISGGNASQVFIVEPLATVSISGLTVEQGFTSGSNGGGIENFGMLTLSNDTVSGNGTASEGGGIENSGTLTVANSTVSGNDATAGGGIDNSAGTVTITNSMISNNFGGGILNLGTLTLTSSTVSRNNNPRGEGGGIANGNIGVMTVTNSTVSDNFAGGDGGGIDNNGGMLTLTNSTVSSNAAPLDGGIENFGTLTVTSSTVSGNSAPLMGGGGINNENAASAILKNTTVANNPAGGNCASAGTFTSDGHNLSDDTSCISLFTGIGDVNDIAAGFDLSGLKNNGGPTETIALLPTSAAVDAVPVSPTNYCTATDGTTPIAKDQRGTTRPQGLACDIGAFELVPSATSTPTPTATPTRTATATPTSTPTPGGGRISVSPLKIPLSTTNDAPVTGDITITNTGTGPLQLTIGTPAHNPPFSETSGAGMVTIGPDLIDTLVIQYAPTKKGNDKDKISLTSDDPTQKKPIKVKLKGDSD